MRVVERFAVDVVVVVVARTNSWGGLKLVWIEACVGIIRVIRAHLGRGERVKR